MTHYETLQVVPWADEPVIRAAYRALMRLYHPDTNPDPEAQLRAREITAAFVVLGDPAKRAAYDAFPTLHSEMDTLKGPPWSIVSMGIVSAGVAAIVLSLTFVAWPQSGERPRHHEPGKTLRYAKVAPVRAPLESLPKRSSVSAVSEHLVSDAPRPGVIAGPSTQSAMMIPKRTIVTKSRTAVQVPRPIAAAAIMPKAGGAIQMTNVSPRLAVVARCPGDSSKAGDGECMNDRQAQVERIAAIFFKQSMDHADSHKQELLLSARTRSAFSRTLCQSSECVTQTYLRQMRDTTDIMQGHVPTP